MTWSIICGGARETLKRFPANSFHSLVTDPPAAIGFMGQSWDKVRGGRNAWIEIMTGIFSEVYRVLRPGAYGLVWGIPRTSAWTQIALEDAGFETRDKIHHVFGSGMPHARDASKAVDLYYGFGEDDRPVVGTYTVTGNAGVPTAEKGGTYGVGLGVAEKKVLRRTIGCGPEARRWDGWHTNLRPGCEDWILVRKPFDSTLAENLLTNGVGALNIDACRVPRDWTERGPGWLASGHTAQPGAEKIAAPAGHGIAAHPLGGWPANLVLSHSEGCREIGMQPIKRNVHEPPAHGDIRRTGRAGASYNRIAHAVDELVPIYECAEDCPVRELDTQSPQKNGASGASRYFNIFYRPKASRKEREAGLAEAGLPIRTAAEATNRKDGQEGINRPHAGAGRGGGVRNDHPTVKDVELMRHLIRLVTPTGGIVLDPFNGSGSTGIGAVLENFEYLGIDEDAHYCDLSRARIAYWDPKKPPMPSLTHWPNANESW